MLPRSSSCACALTLLCLSSVPAPASAQWTFTDVTTAAGVDIIHDLDAITSAQRRTAGGAACGDYNQDGFADLYVIGGNNAQNYLYRNNGDGTFTDVGAAAGVSLPGTIGMGATFADWTGDGWLDLFVGGIEATNRKMFRNNGDGTFSDVTATSGVWDTRDAFSATFGDLDNDDDLDLLLAHWNVPEAPGHIWLNDGTGFFTEADSAVGYFGIGDASGQDYTFTYNVVDLDSDGWNDIVCASDFLTSHVFMNDGDGTFTETTDTTVVNDDNGMGSCVADYDKDGDLDWFVTSIYDGTPNSDGNRLYQNDGTGTFTDVTDVAGVRDGLWGWAAVFQDFNNDTWLDIYHANGWPTASYFTDSSRHFISDGDGTFTEMASLLGTAHVGQGRGVCAFDYDRDGDIDLFLSNTEEQTRLYRNDGGNASNWLGVKLTGPAPNVEQIGARITATVGSSVQMIQLECGNNFLSQDPAEAHFGMGAATQVDVLHIEWTDGTTTTLNNVAANQLLTVSRNGAVDAPAIAAGPHSGLELLGAAPNPFRHGTEIRFRLAAAQRASVRVYDAAGRAVRTITDGALAAGTHEMAWDGRDADGKPAASGIYYYEVRTQDRKARGKLTLLR